MASVMTSYEQRAWEQLLTEGRSRRESLPARGARKVSEAVSAAGDALKRLPGGERVIEVVDESLVVALNAAAKAVFMPAVASVSMERRIKQLRERHPHVGDASPFDVLDLQVLDKGRPKQILPMAGAIASAGASLAVTGAEVSTTVSGGATAGVVLLAIVGDVSASLALLGRAVAEVAVHYGYDPDVPGEEIFLMGVLSFSTSATVPGKAAALSALSRLTQQMMRRATWQELQKDALVKVIQRVFTAIGIRLTHKRLAQVVPVVGGLVSAGLSYDMLHRALADATRIYRARYLADQYGLSFEDLVGPVEESPDGASVSGVADEDEPVDVEALMLEALSEPVDTEDEPEIEDQTEGPVRAGQ